MTCEVCGRLEDDGKTSLPSCSRELHGEDDTCYRIGYERLRAPVPMLLWCPACDERHLDVGEFATKPHHTHACQRCGVVWRPAVVHTVGVQFLPGFKNAETP